MVTDQNYVFFDRIVKLLQWTEMPHIWMIMDHIYVKNPEILCYREVSVFFYMIVKLLQWTEMSHIWMIMDHVFVKNPEILCCPELRGAEMSAIIIAIRFFEKYPAEDRPYLKLIEDYNNLLSLQSNNLFTLLQELKRLQK